MVAGWLTNLRSIACLLVLGGAIAVAAGCASRAQLEQAQAAAARAQASATRAEAAADAAEKVADQATAEAARARAAASAARRGVDADAEKVDRLYGATGGSDAPNAPGEAEGGSVPAK